MRKAPESADDVGMLLCIPREFFIVVGARQLKAVVLVEQRFRMHERQIGKLAFRMRDFLIEAAIDGALRHSAGHGVAVVAASLPAEHVARILIEDDNERQCRFRHLLPASELAACGRLPERKKARRYFLIECRVRLEPLVRSCRAPECQHLVGPGRLLAAALAFLRHCITLLAPSTRSCPSCP